MRAFGRHFRDIRPAATLVEISRLARPTQLIEIEFDAVDGAKDRARRISFGRPLEEQFGYSRAVLMDDTLYVSGTTARDPDGNVVAPGDQYTQTRVCFDIIGVAMEEGGVPLADIVYTKTFVTDMAKSSEARGEAGGARRRYPSDRDFVGYRLDGDGHQIEAEAIIGAASPGGFYTANEREARGYARAVAVGDVVVSPDVRPSTPQAVLSPGDWAARVDLCHECPTGAGDGRRQIGRCRSTTGFTIRPVEPRLW